MTEQFSDQDPQVRLKAAIAERVNEQLGWINEAAQVIGSPEATVEDTFPLPVVENDIARNDAPELDWTPEQTSQMIDIGRRFGYGAEETVPSGLVGGVRIAEGGKAWKIMAEVDAFGTEPDVHTVVFCGSPYRTLGSDELAFLKEKHDIELPADAKEYDLAHTLAMRLADNSHDESVDQAFGYEPTPGNPTLREETGQLLEIGQTSAGQSVQVLRVAGEQYHDDEGKLKERYRPDMARIMTLLAEKLTSEGKLTDPIAVGTSNTYASRVPDTIRASLELSPPRELGVVMYGRAAINALGAPVPKEMPLHQLPGDLRLMHDKLQQLLAEVA